METLTGDRDVPAFGWLVLLGLFDVAVAVGLLLAGRWPALLLLTAAVLGSGACLLTGWFTGARGRPRLMSPRPVRGHEWE